MKVGAKYYCGTNGIYNEWRCEDGSRIFIPCDDMRSCWIPPNPMEMAAMSDLDCPQGAVCVDDQCQPINTPECGPAEIIEFEVKPDSKRKIGPGLLEYLASENSVSYIPATGYYKEYELTEEDHKRFDSIEGFTPEQIAEAKETFRKLKSPVWVDSFKEMLDAMDELWFDKTPAREVVFYTNREGLDLFDKSIQETFEELLK